MRKPAIVGGRSLTSVIDLFNLSLRSERLSPKTISAYMDAANMFVAFAEEQGFPTEPRAIRREHVEGFLVACHEKGNSASTVHQRYRSLRRLFEFVVEECNLEVGPMDRLNPPRLEEKVVKPYSIEQIEAMLAACEGDWMGLRDRALMIVAYDTGLRRAELLQLQTTDVHEEKIVVAGKGSKQRTVRMGYQSLVAVRRYLEARPFVTDHLWQAYGGARLGSSGLYLLIRRRAKVAGVPGADVHRFRHSYACDYLLGGGNQYDLQVSLGHGGPQITQLYVRFVQQAHALSDHVLHSPGDRLRPPRRPRR